MPILFANPRKDKSALSRNSRIRWPKEISINMLANKAPDPDRPTSTWGGGSGITGYSRT